jgi:radical SAM protein with 4Fe4S-binding SPASM domain
MNELHLPSFSAPINVFWETTRACKLKCIHCYNDSGAPLPNELTLDESIRLIDQLAQLKVFRLQFGGGEPLLRKDFFCLVNHAVSKRLHVSIVTSGTLINHEIAHRLHDSEVGPVLVSLDGASPKVNDKIRGAGNFDRAIKGIRALVDNDVEVHVNSVLTKLNVVDIPKIVELATSLGVTTFSAQMFLPLGRGKYNLGTLMPSREQWKDTILSLLRMRKEAEIEISMDPMELWFLKNTSDDIDIGSFESLIGCEGCITQCGITPDGNVLPCLFIPFYRIGNVREENLERIWCSQKAKEFRGSRQALYEECLKCKYGPACRGGCLAMSANVNTCKFEGDPRCALRRVR